MNKTNQINEVSGIQITVPMDTLFLLWRSLEIVIPEVGRILREKNEKTAIKNQIVYDQQIGPLRLDLKKYIENFYGGRIPEGMI